jgi:hypothetical protein
MSTIYPVLGMVAYTSIYSPADVLIDHFVSHFGYPMLTTALMIPGGSAFKDICDEGESALGMNRFRAF